MSSGYTYCACRDCFDETVSSDDSKPELCELCEDAGCTAYREPKHVEPATTGTEYECQRGDAYGLLGIGVQRK